MSPSLSRLTRVGVTTAHIAASLGWLALVVVVVVHPAWRVSVAVLVPTVALSLGTGLVLALGTPYGLVRYWWILAKLCASVALVVAGSAALATGAHWSGTPLVVARWVLVVVLFALVCLSVAKPRARTPWGAPPTGRHHRSKVVP